MNADVGLAIEKDDNLNYKYSLSNKLFDYIQSELPILSSRLVENERLMAKWDIGVFIDNHDAEHISRQINYMLSDQDQRIVWVENLKKAKQSSRWESQEAMLLDTYAKALES